MVSLSEIAARQESVLGEYFDRLYLEQNEYKTLDEYIAHDVEGREAWNAWLEAFDRFAALRGDE